MYSYRTLCIDDMHFNFLGEREISFKQHQFFSGPGTVHSKLFYTYTVGFIPIYVVQ